MREDFERPKPDPDPYRKGLARLGAPASETLVVEDSERGLAAAVAAGIECAVVQNDFTAGQDLSAASWRIGSLAELPSLVAGGRPAHHGR